MGRTPSSHTLPSLPDTSLDQDGVDVEAEIQELLKPLLDSPCLADHKQLLNGHSRDGKWGHDMKDLHILSFAFLFIFVQYSAVQNLESSVNTAQGLGSISLGISYLSFVISSLGAPIVVLSMGSQKSLLLGVLGYWSFICANFYPSWYTLAPSAVLLGFTGSVLWVAQGTYLTCVARNHAAACHISEADALGNFNGEFWSLYSSSQVVGNLVVLAVLQWGKIRTEKSINDVYLFNLMMRFLEADTDAESLGMARLLLPFIGSITIGTILLFFLKPHSDTHTLPNAKISHVAQQGLGKASFALLSDKKLPFLCFLLFYSGLQHAFMCDFTKDVVTSTLGLPWVGGIMAIHGAADTFGSFIAGRSSSGLSSISVIIAGGSFCQILVLAGLFLRDRGSKELVDYIIIFMSAAGWGLGDAAFNTQLSALLGLLYPHDTEAAFAQWRIWKSAAVSVGFFASPFVNFTTKIFILFFSLLVSMGFFFMAILESKRARRLK